MKYLFQDQPAAYRTGKKRYAIQMQAVCNPDLLFLDIFAGYPGSVHDARVFKNSPLFRDANLLFDGNEYIIGDKAYPLLLWCIPPYKNFGTLTPVSYLNFYLKNFKIKDNLLFFESKKVAFFLSNFYTFFFAG